MVHTDQQILHMDYAADAVRVERLLLYDNQTFNSAYAVHYDLLYVPWNEKKVQGYSIYLVV